MNAVVSTILSVSVCLGVAVAGAYAADAIDAVAKDTMPRDAQGRNAMPADSMSRTAAPAGTMSKESTPSHAMSRDSMSRDTMTRTVPQDGTTGGDGMERAPRTR